MHVFRVRVSPGAQESRLRRHGDGFRAQLAAPPEGGRANRELKRLLAQALSLPERELELVGGSRAREKLIRVALLDEYEVRARLEAACDGVTPPH